MNFGDLTATPHTGHFGPSGGSGAAGLAVARWIDHCLLGLAAPEQPPSSSAEAWLERVLEHGALPIRGVSLEGLPPGWIPSLQRAGIPLATEGIWRWGQDLKADTKLEQPHVVEGQLLLPSPEQLLRCSGVQLKSVRRWVAGGIGVRLQAAPGIHVTAWSNQVVLVSTRDESLGGFLHGPESEQRQTLSWGPGQALWVKF